MIIHVNQTLNMPLGKLISQIAHAQCAVVLGCYDFNHMKFRVDTNLLFSTLQNTDIQTVSEQDMQNDMIKIVDQAHTVFNTPTLTTSIYLSADDIMKLHYVANEFDATQGTEVRMVLIAEKSFRKSMKKEDYIKYASLGYAYHLIRLLTHFDILTISQKESLMQWNKGAFAKITLNATIDDIQNLKEIQTLKSLSLLEGLIICGPHSKEELAGLSHLKLL